MDQLSTRCSFHQQNVQIFFLLQFVIFLYKSYLTIFQTIRHYTEQCGKPVSGCYQNEPLLFDELMF